MSLKSGVSGYEICRLNGSFATLGSSSYLIAAAIKDYLGSYFLPLVSLIVTDFMYFDVYIPCDSGKLSDDYLSEIFSVTTIGLRITSTSFLTCKSLGISSSK